MTIEGLRKFLEILEKYYDEEGFPTAFWGDRYHGYEIVIDRWEDWGEKDEIQLLINDSDLFSWASASSCAVDDFDMLEQAYADCVAIDPEKGLKYAPHLYCCRKYNCRPQGAMYPKDERFHQLFHDCGPERKTGFGNPYLPGEGREEAKARNEKEREGAEHEFTLITTQKTGAVQEKIYVKNSKEGYFPDLFFGNDFIFAIIDNEGQKYPDYKWKIHEVGYEPEIGHYIELEYPVWNEIPEGEEIKILTTKTKSK